MYISDLLFVLQLICCTSSSLYSTVLFKVSEVSIQIPAVYSNVTHSTESVNQQNYSKISLYFIGKAYTIKASSRAFIVDCFLEVNC